VLPPPVMPHLNAAPHKLPTLPALAHPPVHPSALFLSSGLSPPPSPLCPPPGPPPPQTINQLGKKAREGTISIDEMAGGTFTISNGGVYGSMLSTPIINPPQVHRATLRLDTCCS